VTGLRLGTADLPGSMERDSAGSHGRPAAEALRASEAAGGACGAQLDWRPVLPRIRVPCLNLVGRRSAIFPWQGTEVVGRLVPACRTARARPPRPRARLAACVPVLTAVQRFWRALVHCQPRHYTHVCLPRQTPGRTVCRMRSSSVGHTARHKHVCVTKFRELPAHRQHANFVARMPCKRCYKSDHLRFACRYMHGGRCVWHQGPQ